ncbi:MAG: DUF177 domain-containing protein [Pseudomonadota bacterium]
MTDTSLIPLAKLPADGPHSFEWVPDKAALQALADDLGILGLRKARAAITLTPQGKRDWQLQATWGATVIQSCVVTLAPVTTRIEGTDSIHYTARMPEITDAETEMPEDETLEPLPAEISLTEVLREMIALALPAYPRAEGAEIQQATFAAEGVTPMSDEDAKPFAGLAGLKEKLEKGDG